MMGLADVEGMRTSGTAFIRGWAPCREALSGPGLASDPFLAGLVPEPTNNLLLMDGEAHQAVRQLVTPYLSRGRVSRFRKQLEATCAEIVRSLPDRPQADLMADLAEPLVLEGIMLAMEIPVSRRPRLCELTRDMLGLLEPDLPPHTRRVAARAALRATMLFTRDGLAGNATGLCASLAEAAEQGRIPGKLASTTPVVLLHGGYENPLNQMGCLIAWAVADPDRFRQAAASAPATLFEEVMRVHSPVRLVARWALADSTRAGLDLDGGQLAWVDLESAHRDQRQFSSPDEIDLTARHPHLGFGYGRHACPGAALARLEGQILIQALLALPADLLRTFAVEWRPGLIARGPTRIVKR